MLFGSNVKHLLCEKKPFRSMKHGISFNFIEPLFYVGFMLYICIGFVVPSDFNMIMFLN